MKKLNRLFLIILAVIAAAVALMCVACDGENPETKPGDDDGKKEPQFVDYAASIKLDFDSETKKQEVTMRLHVDGDTTHFNPVFGSSIATNPSSDFDRTFGFIKARYIAINTPESTGKIEPWGDAASKFTRSKVENAESIVVESDDENWNFDGNMRHILWVWYKPKGADDYRNLNIEILQEGYAFGSSVSNNRYGETAFKALQQARAFKKVVHSGEKDPDYPYGEAERVTLKELRTHIEDYNNKNIKVEGTVTSGIGNCVYIEDVDPESGQRFAIQVFYAYEGGEILEILAIGNRVSVVGVVKYYEPGDTYQISNITYNFMRPTDPANTQWVTDADGNEITEEVPFTEVDPKTLLTGKITVSVEEDKKDENGEVVKDEDGNVVKETVEKELAYGEAIMNTSVIVRNLTVKSVYTTNNGGNHDGALSITCTAEDGTKITVRTEVLYDDDGNLVTEAAFPVGSKITVKGIVDKYNGSYQVCVYRDDYITFVD